MNPKTTDMEVTKLRERVLETVERVLGKEYKLRQQTLELNSLKMLELIVALEEEFGIYISEDAPLARITSSVDRIVEFLLTVTLPAEQG